MLSAQVQWVPFCCRLCCTVLHGPVLCCCRGRGLASAALTYLLGDDEDLEPENSRTALLLAPGKNPSVLDVAVVAAQQVRKLSSLRSFLTLVQLWR